MSTSDAKAPIPQGRYVPAKRHGDTVYISGMTPRQNGVLTMTGVVRASEPLESYQGAVELATANAITAARSVLNPNEQLNGVLSMTVFVATDPSFTAHPKLADFASNYLHRELGDAGIGTRAAVGVATLPGGSPVEIQIVATIGQKS